MLIFENLSRDIIYTILSYLEPHEITNICKTNKTLRKICTSERGKFVYLSKYNDPKRVLRDYYGLEYWGPFPLPDDLLPEEALYRAIIMSRHFHDAKTYPTVAALSVLVGYSTKDNLLSVLTLLHPYGIGRGNLIEKSLFGVGHVFSTIQTVSNIKFTGAYKYYAPLRQREDKTSMSLCKGKIPRGLVKHLQEKNIFVFPTGLRVLPFNADSYSALDACGGDAEKLLHIFSKQQYNEFV